MLLAPDGSLWAWGGTLTGLLGVFPQSVISQIPLRIGSDSDWTQIAGSVSHKVALKSDGSLWAWGLKRDGYHSTPTRVGSATHWARISVGFYSNHTLALKNDGSLWAWGYNYYGQLGDGTTNNRPVPAMIGTDRDWRTIAAGDNTSFALKSNGTLWAWGRGSSKDLAPKQIGSGANWLSISPCDPPSFSGPALLALKTDGTLWLYNYNTNAYRAFVAGLSADFAQIGQDKDWAEVYPSMFKLFARKKDGSCWVFNPVLGQPGLGKNTNAWSFQQRVPSDVDPWAFAPGTGTTLLLGKDAKLWSWGKRLGVEKPGMARKKIRGFLAPMIWQFPFLSFLIKSDIDQTPHLLWELPPEVRRSLGAGSENSTNHLTAGHPANTLHE